MKSIIILIITALRLFSSGLICRAEENNLFAYERLYLSGNHSGILDSLRADSDSVRLLQARTLAHLGEYQEAFKLLSTLDSNAIEAAVIYNRYGNYSRALKTADYFSNDTGFVGCVANYILVARADAADSATLRMAASLKQCPIQLFRAIAAQRLAEYYYNIGWFDSSAAELASINQLFLSPRYLADYHFSYCRIYYQEDNYDLAIDNFENVLADNYLFGKTGKVMAFAIDTLSARLDIRQKIRMIDILRRKAYYREALKLFDILAETASKSGADSAAGTVPNKKQDSLAMAKGWCCFGNKQYDRAAEIFGKLAGSSDSDIVAEALYAGAVCDYRRGLRLDGADKLIDFADRYPNHSLAPRALFTAGDFYQRSDLNKSASMFKRLTDNYPKSRFYSRAIFLQAEAYIRQGLNRRAKELLGIYQAKDDFADLLDFWKFKISRDDSTWLQKIIDRKNASFYNMRARQELGLAGLDSVVIFDDFIRQFFIRAEDFLNRKAVQTSFDLAEIAYADSLFKYGLEYEAGLLLVTIHTEQKNLYQDLAIIKKAYELNLHWAFYEVLDDFKSALQSHGFSFGHETWRRLSYPVLFNDIVNYQARKIGIDPALAISVIRRESQFDPLAISEAGALGLMQLMMPTAIQMAGTKNLPAETLFEPGYNIKLGCKYLQWLEKRLAKKEIVVAAYNAGPAAAKRWKRLAGSDIETYIEAIGYDQSRNYARWVIGDYFWYGNLWPTQFSH